MKNPERFEVSVESSLESSLATIHKKSPEELEMLSKRFDLAKPHEKPKLHEVGKHIQNLRWSLSKPKPPAALPVENRDDTSKLEAIHQESEMKKKEHRTSLTTNALDFLPVIGSAKMIAEGLRGKQFGTDKEIKGLGRLVHTASGVGFLALDMTGIGALASELGKGALKVGEHVAVGAVEKTLEKTITKEAVEVGEKVVEKKLNQEAVALGEKVMEKRGTQVIARGETVLEKETAKLTARGKERAKKGDKIANSPENSPDTGATPEKRTTFETVQNPNETIAEDEKLDAFTRKVLSKNEYKNLITQVNAPKEERVMSSVATTIEAKKLTKKEMAYTAVLGTSLYAGIPAALALAKTSALAFLAPSVASAITAVQGSSLAAAVLPASIMTSLTSMTSLTIGSVFLGLPLLAQAAIVAPALFAAGYVGMKTYKGIKNYMDRRAFKKQFGVSVGEVVK